MFMENQPKAQSVDIEFLNSIIEGSDAEFKKDLHQIFSENTKRNLEKMENSLKEENNNAWYMAAHAFKGAAASIGAFTLSGILEEAQKNPESDKEIKSKIIDRVKIELESVCKIIDQELLK